MPLIGVALGAPLGHAIGSVADYLAATVIVALGLCVLLMEDAEEDRLLSLTQRGLVGAVALGVSISLDELAIGVQRRTPAPTDPGNGHRHRDTGPSSSRRSACASAHASV